MNGQPRWCICGWMATNIYSQVSLWSFTVFTVYDTLSPIHKKHRRKKWKEPPQRTTEEGSLFSSRKTCNTCCVSKTKQHTRFTVWTIRKAKVKNIRWEVTEQLLGATKQHEDLKKGQITPKTQSRKSSVHLSNMRMRKQTYRRNEKGHYTCGHTHDVDNHIWMACPHTFGHIVYCKIDSSFRFTCENQGGSFKQIKRLRSTSVLVFSVTSDDLYFWTATKWILNLVSWFPELELPRSGSSFETCHVK